MLMPTVFIRAPHLCSTSPKLAVRMHTCSLGVWSFSSHHVIMCPAIANNTTHAHIFGSAGQCYGEDCATECIGVDCGSTSPHPQIRRRLPLLVPFSLEFLSCVDYDDNSVSFDPHINVQLARSPVRVHQFLCVAVVHTTR